MSAPAARAIAAVAALTARDRLLIRAARGGPMTAPGDQLAALRDAVSALRDAGIDCAVIGGIAVGVRAGVPRATDDVDLAVPSQVGRSEVIAVLTAAGFALRGEHPHSVNFRHCSGEPLQLAFDPAFDPAIERAEPVALDDVTVPVVRTDDLVVMKERAGRDPARRRSKALRDLADVELLRGDVAADDEGW